MTATTILTTGLAFGESPRWHDGRLWLCDWAAHEVLTVDEEGTIGVVCEVQSFPFCIDFLPDGRLLVLSADDEKLLRREEGGELVTHADLAGLAEFKWNDIAVDGRGNAFVNNIGFEYGGEFAPGFVSVVAPDGSTRRVADDLAFPNGMVVTPDSGTLVVAESYACRLTAFDIADDGTLSDRRVWADLGDCPPDGICLDADGAVWFGDVPHGHARRVAEGGEVLATVDLDRGCLACALGGHDGRTLFMVATDFTPDAMSGGARTGQVVTCPAPAPRADRPAPPGPVVR